MTTKPNTIEIYADTRGVGVCRSDACRRRILWAEVVKTGKRMCFDDPELVALSTRVEPDTRRLIEMVDRDNNHWATCPDSKTFKRRS